MNTEDIASLAGFATASVFVVQFLRNLLGANILNGARTQAVAMAVSIGFGFLAAETSREFDAERDDIVGTIVLVFMLGQSIYNLAFRNTGFEKTVDNAIGKVTSRINGRGDGY